MLETDLYKQETPQIKSQTMRRPIIENEHLWVCTKFMCLYIPISLFLPIMPWSVSEFGVRQQNRGIFLKINLGS